METYCNESGIVVDAVTVPLVAATCTLIFSCGGSRRRRVLLVPELFPLQTNVPLKTSTNRQRQYPSTPTDDARASLRNAFLLQTPAVR